MIDILMALKCLMQYATSCPLLLSDVDNNFLMIDLKEVEI